MERPQQIVFCCTANRIRSVFAHYSVLQLDLRPPWAAELPVISVGTKALAGEAPIDKAIRVAEEFGVDISEHLSTPIRAEDHVGAWWIGMTREHLVAPEGVWRSDLLGSFSGRGAIADPIGFPEELFPPVFDSILISLRRWSRTEAPS